MRWLRIALRVVAVLCALLVLLMVALQIVLSPRVCTRLVEKYYPYLIDGTLSLGSASVSVFSHFPAVTLDIDDFVVTYPETGQEGGGQGNHLELAGRNPQSGVDTLACFEKFSVGVNVLALADGRLRVKNLELSKPRVYIHTRPNGTTNLDVIKLPDIGEDTVSSSGGFVLKELLFKKCRIEGPCLIVYTDPRQEIYALGALRNMDCKGGISAKNPLADRFSSHVDSLLVTGKLGTDTLLFALDRLSLDCKDYELDFGAAATAFAATRSFGRLKIPADMSGSLRISDVRKGSYVARLEDFSLDVASVHLEAGLEAAVGDTIALKGSAVIPGVSAEGFMTEYLSRFIPDLAKIRTDASLSARLDVDGWYLPGMKGFPSFKASLQIPHSDVSMDGYEFSPSIELEATASAPQCGPLAVSIKRCSLAADGLEVDLAASSPDVLCKDPRIRADFSLDASVNRILEQTGDLLKFKGSGDITAKGSGSFRISNLNLYNLYGMEFQSEMGVKALTLTSTDDSLKLYCNSLSASLGKLKTSKRQLQNGKGAASKPRFGFNFDVDSLYMAYQDMMTFTARGVRSATNAYTEVIKVSDSVTYNPLRFTVNADRLFYMDSDSISIRLTNTQNRVGIRPDRDDVKRSPKITVSSSNGRLRLNMGPHRFSLGDLNFKAAAKMRDDSRSRRLKTIKDSLLNAHKDWNEDTLRARFAARYRDRELPEWLSEEDFLKKDPDFTLSGAFRRYFDTWDLNADLSLDRMRIYTPFFPQKTVVRDFKGSLDNDRIGLDSLRLLSGSSDIELSGAVTGLRRVFAGRGIPKLRFEVCSDTLALNEIIGTLVQGQRNMQDGSLEKIASMSDEKYEALVAEKQAAQARSDTTSGMIVVPSNIDAELSLRGHRASWSTLDVSSFSADMKMKHRTLLLSDFNAVSNVGSVNLDAFYSTVNKKRLSTGFDIEFDDISAAQVISLIPQFDTLMPLLKTFDGMLDCSIAATASLDTNMNIIPGSINGVVRISGTDLRFSNDKQVEKLARMLLFREPKDAHIDSMKVEGVLNDGRLEIFPFILKMDRWTVAIAGIQSLDKTFSYHASLLKSPIVLRLGANLYGDNFDDIKFKLGKPRFKKEDAVPSFTAIIDTTRMNLLHNIREVLEIGVDKAVRQNRAQEAIERERRSQDYLRSASLDTLDALSESERRKAEEAEAVPSAVVATDTVKVR